MPIGRRASFLLAARTLLFTLWGRPAARPFSRLPTRPTEEPLLNSLSAAPAMDPALPEAEAVRRRAGELAAQRNQAFAESQEAFKQKDGSRAKELSEAGKKYQSEMEECNRRAAHLFFDAHNRDKGENEIDLHGLFVEEALERVKERLDHCSCADLTVIVGAGNHSEGGIRKIKPKLVAYLQERGLTFDDDTPNVGCIVVHLKVGVAVPEVSEPVPTASSEESLSSPHCCAIA